MSQCFKVKHRWTVEWRVAKTWQLIAPPAFVKIDSRPSLSFEVAEVNFLKSSFYIPGKASWQEMKITYPDIDAEDGSALFFRWVSEQYKETNQEPLWSAELACVILRNYNGSGEVLEQWYLDDAMVTALDFGCLGYTSAECELNVAIKYREAEYVDSDPSKWLKPIRESSFSY
jgi:hypothetical protein